MKNTNTKAHKIPWVADQLEIDRSTVYRLVDKGELVKIKIGPKAARITDESFRAYFARCASAGGA